MESTDSISKPSLKNKLTTKIKIMADKLQHVDSKEVQEDRQRKNTKKMEALRKAQVKDKKKLEKDQQKIDQLQKRQSKGIYSANNYEANEQHPYIRNDQDQLPQPRNNNNNSTASSPAYQPLVMQNNNMQQPKQQQQLSNNQHSIQNTQVQNGQQPPYRPLGSINQHPRQQFHPDFFPPSNGPYRQSKRVNFRPNAGPYPLKIKGNAGGSVSGQPGMIHYY